MGAGKRVLQLNAPLGGMLQGAKVPVKVDSDGVVIDLYWRRRVKDALTDNCVEFVESKVPKASRKAE